MKITGKRLREMVKKELRAVLSEAVEQGQCVTGNHPAVIALRAGLKAAGITEVDPRTVGGRYETRQKIGPPLMALELTRPHDTNNIRAIGHKVQKEHTDINFGWTSLSVAGAEGGSFFGTDTSKPDFLLIFATFINDKNVSLVQPWQDLTNDLARARSIGYGC